VSLEFADYDLPTISRAFLYLYTGDYSDECYPNLGHSAKSSLPVPLEETTNLQKMIARQEHDEHSKIQDPSSAPQIEPTKASRVTSLAIENLKVYLCAKTLVIEPLKALALVKLDSRSRNDIKSAGLAPIFSFVYQHTRSEDLDVRTVLMRICAENMAVVERDAVLLPLLKKHEPMAWTLLEEKLIKTIQLPATVRATDREQQERINKLKAECETLRNETKSVSTALVKFNGSDQALQATSLAAENLLLEQDKSRLERENETLKNEQQALQRKLRQENGKRRNEQHNSENSIFRLKARLRDAESRLSNAESGNRAWGTLKNEKKSLKAEVQRLEALLDDA